MKPIILKPWFCTLFLALFLLGMTGCLDFDGQEVHLRYDGKQDRLDALLIYRGLYSDDGKEIQKAMDQLGEMISHRRIYFASNWPFEVDFDKLAKSTDSDLARLLARSTTVRNSALWKDGEDRPCGYQLVRITKVSDILAVANAEFAKYLLTDEGLKSFTPENTDPESLKLLRNAAERKHRFFAFRGSAFTFSFPVSDVGARQFRLQLLNEANKSISQEKENEAKTKEAGIVAELLARNDFGIERVGNDLAFVLGNPPRKKILVEVPSTGKYQNNLAAPLKDQGWKLDAEGSLAKARQAFADFCSEK